MLDIRRNAQALSRSLFGHFRQNRTFTGSNKKDQFWIANRHCPFPAVNDGFSEWIS
jgi:hypothetical protein